MELFVINRHGDEKPEITEEEEKAKLDGVLKKIERKKQARIRQRERQKEQKKVKKPKPEPQQPTNDEKPSEKSEPIDTTTTQQKPSTKSELKGFTVLGSDTSFKKAKAERVLPQWLKNPTVISTNLQNLSVKASQIKELDKSIRKQLKSNGVKYLFPVQAEVIPWLVKTHKHSDILFPRDVCVSAPTGSGKTLAFVLPVIQALKHHTIRKIRALVILPTQDLADQVFKEFRIYSQNTNIETAIISGKHPFNNEQKQLLYKNESFGYVSKVDILVCTPGRLVSHLKTTQGLDLQALEFLIIDEADRVLENLQDDWLYHLEKHRPMSNACINLATLQKQKPPQKLLFSATLTQDPEKIEKLSLFQPKLFTCVAEDAVETDETSFAGRFTTPKELTEKFIVGSKDLKPLLLYQFIKTQRLTKTLIFTHSVESAHRLTLLLRFMFKSKLKIGEISSSLKGKERDGLIADFSRGEVDVLICTDALARGIDLPGVQCVVSYSAPKYVKTYVHRSGRTARAGENGLAVTLLHKEQLSSFKSLLGQLKKSGVEEVKIDEVDLESRAKLYKKALKKLKEAVGREEMVGMQTLLSKKKALIGEKKAKLAKSSSIMS